MICLVNERCAQIRMEVMERDGLCLVAGSAGLGQHVRLAHWLNRKWAIEQEKISVDGRLKKFREPKWSRRRKKNETLSPQAYTNYDKITKC